MDLGSTDQDQPPQPDSIATGISACKRPSIPLPSDRWKSIIQNGCQALPNALKTLCYPERLGRFKTSLLNQELSISLSTSKGSWMAKQDPDKGNGALDRIVTYT
jgi:hypothetical protein